MGNQRYRMEIEAAINNDMQLIQQKDSQLSYQWISENDDAKEACSNPGSYLATQIKNADGPFGVKAKNKNDAGNVLFTRSLSGSTVATESGAKLLTRVKYNFDGPEQSVEKESRIVEL